MSTAWEDLLATEAVERGPELLQQSEITKWGIRDQHSGGQIVREDRGEGTKRGAKSAT